MNSIVSIMIFSKWFQTCNKQTSVSRLTPFIHNTSQDCYRDNVKTRDVKILLQLDKVESQVLHSWMN